MSGEEYVIIDGRRIPAFAGIGATDPSGNAAANMVLNGIGPSSQPRIRHQQVVAETNVPATNSFTWKETDNIREVTILATDAATAGAVGIEDYLIVCFNAGSDAIAASWLTLASSVTDDVQYHKVFLGVPRTFRFTSPLTRADALAVDRSGAATGMDVIMEGH